MHTCGAWGITTGMSGQVGPADQVYTNKTSDFLLIMHLAFLYKASTTLHQQNLKLYTHKELGVSYLIQLDISMVYVCTSTFISCARKSYSLTLSCFIELGLNVKVNIAINHYCHLWAENKWEEV